MVWVIQGISLLRGGEEEWGRRWEGGLEEGGTDIGM